MMATNDTALSAKHTAGADRHDQHTGRAPGRRCAPPGRSRCSGRWRSGRSAGRTISEHERLPGRVVDRERHARTRTRSRRASRAATTPVRSTTASEHGHGGHRDLRCSSEHRALVEAVGEDAAPHAEQQRRARTAARSRARWRRRCCARGRSTSQPSAMVCIHVPHCEISWPTKNSRKLRTCIDSNVVARERLHAHRRPAGASRSGERPREQRRLGVGELGDALGEVGVLAGAAAGEQLAAGRR